MALRPINMKAIHGVNFKEFKVRRSYSVVSWACLHIILPSLAHSVIDSIPVWFFRFFLVLEAYDPFWVYRKFGSVRITKLGTL